jgi:hypothetical protein
MRQHIENVLAATRDALAAMRARDAATAKVDSHRFDRLAHRSEQWCEDVVAAAEIEISEAIEHPAGIDFGVYCDLDGVCKVRRYDEWPRVDHVRVTLYDRSEWTAVSRTPWLPLADAAGAAEAITAMVERVKAGVQE